MYAALSAVSSQGIWILVDSRTHELIAELSWTDDNSTGLSTEMAPQFTRILEKAGRRTDELRGLWGVSGPGAFTGLRLSSAFLQGLARSLRLPLRAIPSRSLFDQDFLIPLRHQKARFLNLEEALKAGIEFLEISTGAAALKKPDAADLIVGLRDRPLWPSADELRAGLLRNEKTPEGLALFYGLEPKISGQRTAT